MQQRPGAILLVLFLPLFALSSTGQDTRATESELKAAFLYNFTKFTDWPSDAFPTEKAPIHIGVFADEEFTNILRVLLEGKQAHGRSFLPKNITDPIEAQSCHVLFVREPHARSFPRILELIRDSPVLTVGEFDGFLEEGGMLKFDLEENRLRFEVSPTAAEKARLLIRSQLLRLASRVHRGGTR